MYPGMIIDKATGEALPGTVIQIGRSAVGSEMSADKVYGMDYIIIQEFIDKTIRKQPVIETSYYKIYN
jgi:hypothetical protein